MYGHARLLYRWLSELAAEAHQRYPLLVLRQYAATNHTIVFEATLSGCSQWSLMGALTYLALLLRVESEHRALREAQKAGGDIMHVTLALKWWVLPLIGLVAFTIGSALLQTLSRYRKARRMSNS